MGDTDIWDKKHRLHEEVVERQFLQDTQFYSEILSINDKTKAARAWSDLLNSSRIPVVRNIDGSDALAQTAQNCLFPPLISYDAPRRRQENDLLTTNSPNAKSLGKISAGKSRLDILREEAELQARISAEIEREKLRNEKISAAFNQVELARRSKDPAECYYKAATLFNEQQMYDRAVVYFLRALETVSSEDVVDTYFLPNSDQHKRKLSRLGKKQLIEYMSERQRMRNLYIMEDEQRQFIRLQNSHCELFRIYLIQNNKVAAHKHLLLAFQICDRMEKERIEMQSPNIEFAETGATCEWTGHTDDEYHSSRYKLGTSGNTNNKNKSERRIVGDGEQVRINTLVFAHNNLKKYATPQNPEVPINTHILKCSAGPLAEAHIVILRELLSIFPDVEEYASHMGMRYAEKCDFNEAHKYYQLARIIADPTPADLQTCLGQRLSRSTDSEKHIASFMKHTSKTVLTSFDVDTDADLKRMKEMKDYTHFLGKHKGIETIVFIPPASGWSGGVEEKRKQRKQKAIAE